MRDIFGKLLGTSAGISIMPSHGAIVAEWGRAVAPRGGARPSGGLAGGRRRFERPDGRTFLLDDDRVHAMCRAVGVGFSSHN